MNDPGGPGFVCGLVLAAGGSRRLGRPKQLLPYRGAPLLEQVLGTGRAVGFDQLLCAVGGAAPELRERIDWRGVEVVENPDYGEGCASSIAAALAVVDPRCELLVLMLGDQPGVRAQTVRALLAGRGDSPLAACAYEDGRGHPLAFARSTFDALASLHGDRGVWRLLDRAGGAVADVPIAGTIPPDIDTWDDYLTLRSAAADT